MNFCHNCGKPLRQGVKFCPNCGAAVLPPLEPEQEVAAATQPRTEAPNKALPAEYLDDMTNAIDDALESRLADHTRPWASINPPPRQETLYTQQPSSQADDSFYETLPNFTYSGTGTQKDPLPQHQRPDYAKEEITTGEAEYDEPESGFTTTKTKQKIDGVKETGTAFVKSAEQFVQQIPPATRRNIIVGLCCLAGVLVILLGATLINSARSNAPANSSSQSEAGEASSEGETAGVVAIPGPGQPSALKTGVAEAIPLQFIEADQFQKNGLARVKTADGWELIDKTGKFITEKAFEEIGYYNDGWCIVKDGNRYAFIDEQGLPMGGKYTWYRTVQPFSEGRALVETMGGKYVYLDAQGNIALTPTLSAKSYGSYKGGLARVAEDDGKVTYMDLEGNVAVIAKDRFADGKTFDAQTGLCPVTNSDQGDWYYISSKEANLPPALSGFESASTFENGSAVVKRDGKMFHIRSDGSAISATGKYDEVWRFSDGYATVRIGDKYGYVDTSGKEVIPVTLEDVWSFGDGLTPAKLTDKWGYLDAQNQTAIGAQWDECYKFYDGVAKFRQDGKFGYLNTSGTVLVFPKYKSAGYNTQGMLPVCDADGRWGYLAVQ
ncbi:MAG: WG repeat-containing protein [Angelakisella sp.]|nr:WG repeat-containing protein [Angelakisella sp.]